MISVCEKVRLQQLRKAKYSILASILQIFKKNFLQRLIPTCGIYCVDLMVFLYHALNVEEFFKNGDFLEKFIFEQDPPINEGGTEF